VNEQRSNEENIEKYEVLNSNVISLTPNEQEKIIRMYAKLDQQI
jgi:hypothetical protein